MAKEVDPDLQEEVGLLLQNGEGASLVAQIIKNLPAMQETWVQSLGREDPLEKRMETHSSILAWTDQPGGLGIHGVTKSKTV